MKKILLLKMALLFVLLFLVFTSIKYVFFNDILQTIAYQKVWVHRVNSTEKLQEVQEKFASVELDLVFNDTTSIFDVNHPPAPSIQLSLNKYLSFHKNNTFYWLDFKNLTKENQSNALKQLLQICSEQNIPKENIVVESPQIKLLAPYKTAGFQISYYYHWPGLFSLNEQDKKNLLAYMREQIALDNEIILSADFKDFDILKQEFPERTKMFWTTNKTPSLKEMLTLKNIVANPKTKALLIQYKSKAKNR